MPLPEIELNTSAIQQSFYQKDSCENKRSQGIGGGELIRVVTFQSRRINEPTSCSSMLGFLAVMKSRFLSSTKDVAHPSGMTLG